MTKTTENTVYSKARFVLDLAPTNTIVKDAVVNMMTNHREQWDELIYQQLLAGSPTRTQSLIIGDSEDMITMLLVTAKYEIYKEEPGHMIVTTESFGICSGVAKLASCSTDALFIYAPVDKDGDCYYRMLAGSCYSLPDYQVSISLSKDDAGKWYIDSLASHSWMDNDEYLHSKITRVNLTEINDYLAISDRLSTTPSEEGKMDIFTKEDLLALGVQCVDVSKVGGLTVNN